MNDKTDRKNRMITKLLKDAVTVRRIYDGVHDIINVTGGNADKFAAGAEMLGLEVAIELMLDELDEPSSEELAPYLDEMFYQRTANPESLYKDANDMAIEILRGWNSILVEYTEYA